MPELPDLGQLAAEAKEVIALASDEARRRSHEHVGTDHLLLGLLSHGSGLAVRVLHTLGVDPRRIHAEMDRAIQSGSGSPVEGEIPLTPRAKEAIEFAYGEAVSQGKESITQDCLLLGLMEESEGIASHVLQKFGITVERVREHLRFFKMAGR